MNITIEGKINNTDFKLVLETDDEEWARMTQGEREDHVYDLLQETIMAEMSYLFEADEPILVCEMCGRENGFINDDDIIICHECQEEIAIEQEREELIEMFKDGIS